MAAAAAWVAAACAVGAPPPSHLAPRTFAPLPLGAIAPQGWVLEQLVRQASTLSGYASTTLGLGGSDHADSDVINKTKWLGGPGGGPRWLASNDQWFPYWADGNVPLVALLRASGALGRLPADLDLASVVDGYMAHVLDRDVVGGWIAWNVTDAPGIALGEGGYQMVQSLLQWSEDKPRAVRRRVASAVVAHLLSEAARDVTPEDIQSWTATRWPTFVTLVDYVVDVVVPEFAGDAAVLPRGAAATASALVSAAHRIADLGMDYRAFYHQTKAYARTGNRTFPNGSAPDWNVWQHGVNNAEGGFRWPAALYRLNGSRADGETEMAFLLSAIDREQGQVQGTFCADECFCGRNPNRGTETCTVVEEMFSLESAFATFGTPSLQDRVERLAFNALPAALTGDMWTHVYVQQANSVFAGVTHPTGGSTARSSSTPPARPSACSGRPACRSAGEARMRGAFGRGGPRDGEVCLGPSCEDENTNYYGVSHFPCCFTNFPQGWPKFAQSAVLLDASTSPPSVVLASLVPLSATVAAASATVEVDGQYPFSDAVNVTLRCHAAATSVRIRVPGWAVGATVDGAPVANGTFHAVACPSDGATVRVAVELRPAVRWERGWGNATANAVAVSRGPIVFALHPTEQRRVTRTFDATPPRPLARDYEISTSDPWNYMIDTSGGLAFDGAAGGGWSPSFAFDDAAGVHPFSVAVRGCLLPSWGYWRRSNLTDTPPPSPVEGGCAGRAVEQLRLVPFGGTNIRVSVFPWA